MNNPSPTNITERISYLRERKKNSEIIGEQHPEQPKKQRSRRAASERKFATDYFMLFVYSLLAIAILSQFILITWLDII